MADEESQRLTLSATNVMDVLSNTRGGLHAGTRAPDRLDLVAAYAGDADGFPGWRVLIGVQATDATNFNSALTGSLQGISSLDGPVGLRLANAWISKDFEGIAGLKAGIVDLNSEFDVQQTGALFLNPSHGIGPDFSQSGRNGPSIFPSTGLGIVGWWLPGDHWELKSGVFEDTPGNPDHLGRTELSLSNDDGALLAFELRNRPSPDWALGIGGWLYTAAFETLDTTHAAHGNGGVYAIADGKLYSEDAQSDRGLNGWIRTGFANDAINLVAFYLGGGIVYTGIGERDNDQLGFALARAQLGNDARHLSPIPLARAETVFEATYNLVLGENLAIQPDLQYVLSPGADKSLRNALVAGVRITTSLHN